MAISVGSAVGAAFSLMGRRPLSVVSWGFFAYLAMFALLGIGVAIVGLPALARIVSLNGRAPDPAEARQMALQFFVALWPALLIVAVGALFVGAVVQGAAIRSILYPDHRAFASLRFGRSEAALALLGLLFIPILAVAGGVSVLALGGVVYAGRLIHGIGGGLVVFFGCLGYGLAFMWVALRFSLAAAMTFAEGRVRFFGSWSLTRGEGWRLFGLGWLMLLVWIGVLAAYSILSGVVNLIFAGAAVASIMSTSGAGPGATPDMAAVISHWPILLLAYLPSLMLGAAFNGVVQALAQAPWADVYRQLKGQPDVASAFA